MRISKVSIRGRVGLARVFGISGGKFRVDCFSSRLGFLRVCLICLLSPLLFCRGCCLMICTRICGVVEGVLIRTGFGNTHIGGDYVCFCTFQISSLNFSLQRKVKPLPNFRIAKSPGCYCPLRTPTILSPPQFRTTPRCQGPELPRTEIQKITEAQDRTVTITNPVDKTFPTSLCPNLPSHSYRNPGRTISPKPKNAGDQTWYLPL